jgi:hypothetical protein
MDSLEFQHGSARVALEDTGVAAGDIASLANPEGVTLIVERVYVLTTTFSTGAATLDIGIAANGTTLSDNLIDGLAVGSATGLFSNLKNPGSNGKADQLWTSGQFLTASEASGDATGLAGWLIVDYRRADFAAAS